MSDERPGDKATGPGMGDLRVADWGSSARPTLGDVAPVLAFSALRLGAVGTIADAGLSGEVYLAGRNWACSLTFGSLVDTLRSMTELRLGLPRLIGQTPDQMEIEI